LFFGKGMNFLILFIVLLIPEKLNSGSF